MENQNNTNNGAMLAALGYPVALPQTVEQYPTYKHSVQRTQYDPNKMRALVEALRTPQQTEKGKWELLDNALAKNITSPQYEGAYGVKFGDYRTNALAQGANMFNDIYGAQKQQERDAANAARENEIKALQMELDTGKQVISDENGMQWIKFNNPNAGGDASYRFTPERIQEMKELNDKAGRWSTEWGAGMSDMMNTETARAWTEFEGLAKQYVQDQLKKIYGASMTEQEGERFFKSMGLSRYTDPSVRWSLLTHQLNDLAIKNGVRLQLDPIPGQNTTTVAGTNMQQQATQQRATNARPLPQKGQIVDGYEFLGGDPADAKNWRAK